MYFNIPTVSMCHQPNVGGTFPLKDFLNKRPLSHQFQFTVILCFIDSMQSAYKPTNETFWMYVYRVGKLNGTNFMRNGFAICHPNTNTLIGKTITLTHRFYHNSILITWKLCSISHITSIIRLHKHLGVVVSSHSKSNKASSLCFSIRFSNTHSQKRRNNFYT